MILHARRAPDITQDYYSYAVHGRHGWFCGVP
jgi:hypothetical protein